jgi:hypothetical protein
MPRRPTHLDRGGVAGPAASKVEVRKVTTFLASDDLTVWIALPA